MRVPALLVLAGCAACARLPIPPTTRAPAIDPAPLAADARWLADDAREGRGTGTPGADAAATYLAGALAGLRLEPVFRDGEEPDLSYVQAFDVVTGVGRGDRTQLLAGGQPIAPGEAFELLSFSDDGDVEAEVVFAGHGITAPELGWDDYSGVDVKGRIVVVLAHEPRERDEKSPFRTPDALRYRELRYKALNAREHGAKAILIAPDAYQHEGGAEPVPALRGDGRGSSSGILAAAISTDAADALLGTRSAELAGALARGPAPKATGRRARFVAEVIKRRSEAKNVCGRIPGRDPTLAGEVVVVGAHYDHLGHGGESSLAPDALGSVHNGADDNASGTAAVLAMARALAKEPARRSVLACFFSGEEMGLLGSAHYVKNAAVPVEKTVAMLNLDMVGRLRDGRLLVFGLETADELRPLVTALGRDFRLALAGDGFGPSDHTSFYAAGVPVLFLSTGAHEDYHRPSDDFERLNVEGLAKVATFAGALARSLGDADAKPVVKRGATPPPAREGGRGYGPYFGTIPDFTESDVPGVRLTGVRDGSPAHEAGLQAGDVLVRFAGYEIRNLHDYTYALRSKRAGDEIEIVWKRGDAQHSARAVLEERKQAR